MKSVHGDVDFCIALLTHLLFEFLMARILVEMIKVCFPLSIADLAKKWIRMLPMLTMHSVIYAKCWPSLRAHHCFSKNSVFIAVHPALISKPAVHALHTWLFFLCSGKAKEKSSDAEWLKTVTASGTLGDKVAALTVQIQVVYVCSSVPENSM